MAVKGRTTFGSTVRRERERLEIGLREMASIIGISPTYLSKIERDEFSPPAEDKVLAIAEVLELDPDELLALAGRVSSELTEIIINHKHTREMTSLLRAAKGLTAEELTVLAQQAREAKKRRRSSVPLPRPSTKRTRRKAK